MIECAIATDIGGRFNAHQDRMYKMNLTEEQRRQVAQIVSDKVSYIDVRSYTPDCFDCEEWLELAQEFADAIATVSPLEAIVRDLAAVECPVSTIVSEITGDVAGLCPTCGATLTSEFDWLIEPHEDGCVYVRAVEWVAEHPANEGGGG